MQGALAFQWCLSYGLICSYLLHCRLPDLESYTVLQLHPVTYAGCISFSVVPLMWSHLLQMQVHWR